MNVSAISAAPVSFDPALQSDMARRHQDFNALQSALQSGNVTSAQSAFAAFLQDVQTTAARAGSQSVFAPGSQPRKDLDAVGSALKAADISGAQKAFSALAQDLQSSWQPANGEPLAVAPPHHHLNIGGGHRAFTANAGAANATEAAGKLLNIKA